ncbi:hypothetical protein ACJ72_04108 [Emergomyces africanus]|uniref:Major facilitator superfamily (MFS) profile domain-containing protein n=1 Tax=Emergomyces africanus TaxID=1955775 RepID=A0A1B7NXQ6_9EURO|nr:hypothetical protein ACJ72_04108 [Emergomyces africanus]
MGWVNPLGYAVGLVLGDILTNTVGWRWTYYLMAIINPRLSLVAIWPLLSVVNQPGVLKPWTRRHVEDIDWLGTVINSVVLGIQLYALAMASSSYRRVRDPLNIALLVVSCFCLLLFRAGCIIKPSEGSRHSSRTDYGRRRRSPLYVLLSSSAGLLWTGLNILLQSGTNPKLHFQRVEGFSAPQSSIRFLAYVVTGAAVNVATAFLISRVKALLLSPVNPDNAFPAEIQSLAGGIFNEVSQFGIFIRLAVTASITASVTEPSGIQEHRSALIERFRASFWTIFAATAIVVVISFFELKKGGAVSKKDA